MPNKSKYSERLDATHKKPKVPHIDYRYRVMSIVSSSDSVLNIKAYQYCNKIRSEGLYK